MIYIESISYPWSGMSCNYCDVHQGYKLVSHPVLGIWINVTIGFQVHLFFGKWPDLGLVRSWHETTPAGRLDAVSIQRGHQLRLLKTAAFPPLG